MWRTCMKTMSSGTLKTLNSPWPTTTGPCPLRGTSVLTSSHNMKVGHHYQIWGSWCKKVVISKVWKYNLRYNMGDCVRIRLITVLIMCLVVCMFIRNACSSTAVQIPPQHWVWSTNQLQTTSQTTPQTTPQTRCRRWGTTRTVYKLSGTKETTPCKTSPTPC